MADPPAMVNQAGPAELTVTMPSSGSVLLRIPWSPVLGIEGATDTEHGCLAPGRRLDPALRSAGRDLPHRRQRTR